MKFWESKGPKRAFHECYGERQTRTESAAEAGVLLVEVITTDKGPDHLKAVI